MEPMASASPISFKALQYVRSVTLSPREKNSGTGRQAFRFNGAADEPSSFDRQFVAESKLYRFIFKANDQRMTEESLVQVERGKGKILYERITDESGKEPLTPKVLKTRGETDSARTGGGTAKSV